MNSERCIGGVATASRRRRRAGWLCALLGLGTFAVAAAGLLYGHAQSSPAQSATAAAQAPASQLNNLSAQGALPSKQPDGGATQDPQKQEIANEAADLLKMATVLKSEVDKTTKDQLSVKVVRKAGEIEQLAHKARLGTGKG
jgi:hypothetical protein